jgi:tripartite-type tricarboxylate transporter receptor subunit TctC
MGGTGLNGINDLNSALFLRMIGARYKHVVGYRGQAEVMQALRRNEVNLADAGITAYLPNRASWEAEGLFTAILQRGVLGDDGAFHRHAILPKLPTMAEAVAAIRPAAMKTPEFAAFRALVGTYNVQFALVLPPGADKAVHDTLARAVAETFRDPDARRSAIKRFKVDYDFSDGPTAQRHVERLFEGYNADPAIAKVVQALLKSG